MYHFSEPIIKWLRTNQWKKPYKLKYQVWLYHFSVGGWDQNTLHMVIQAGSFTQRQKSIIKLYTNLSSLTFMGSFRSLSLSPGPSFSSERLGRLFWWEPPVCRHCAPHPGILNQRNNQYFSGHTRGGLCEDRSREHNWSANNRET